MGKTTRCLGSRNWVRWILGIGFLVRRWGREERRQALDRGVVQAKCDFGGSAVVRAL